MINVRRMPQCAVCSLARVACSCGHVPPCCKLRTAQHSFTPTYRAPRSVALMLGRMR